MGVAILVLYAVRRFQTQHGYQGLPLSIKQGPGFHTLKLSDLSVERFTSSR